MGLPDEGLNDARKVDFSTFREEINALLGEYDGQNEHVSPQLDTVFHPSVQAGWADVRSDEHLLESVLSQ